MPSPTNMGAVSVPVWLVDPVTGLPLAMGTGASSQTFQGTAADGAAAVGNPVQVAGVDSAGNVQALLVTTTGALNLNDLKSSTGTKSAVASGITSVTILASNANRKGATVTNTDANALYLDLSGGTASSTSFSVAVATNGYYEIPFGFTGLITGIWAADGAGSALVTEFV